MAVLQICTSPVTAEQRATPALCRFSSKPLRAFRPSRPFVLLLALSLPLILPAQSPSDPAQVLRSAEQSRTRHQDHIAEALLLDALKFHPADASLLTELARVKLDQSDQPAAEQLLAQALDASPNSIEANDLLGSLLLSAHRYPQAMDRFETVLAVSLNDAQARAGELQAATSLALQARSEGNREAALLCLEHAAEHLPGSLPLLTDIGMVAGELHLFGKAQHALTAALAIDPHDPRALYAAARVETDAQHLPAAETYLRSYLALRPADATAHFGLGRVLALQLKVPEARQELERSIALQPTQTESFYELGLLAMNDQDDAEAKRLFDKVLDRFPKHGGALTALGQIAFRARDYTAAQRNLVAAVASAPDYQPAHYYLGLTLGRLGDREASQQQLTLAADLARKQQGKAEPVASEASP